MASACPCTIKHVEVEDLAWCPSVPGQEAVVLDLEDHSQDQLAALARAWSANGAGAVGEGEGEAQPQAPPSTNNDNNKVWTVDGWSSCDCEPKKKSARHSNHTNNSNSSGNSHSDTTDSDSSFGDSSSGSTTGDSSSGGSLGCGQGWVPSKGFKEGGCCACMCPTAFESEASKPGPGPPEEGIVMPGNGPLPLPRRARFCNALALKEDNARFLLLALVLLLYMVAGALIFQALEENNEIQERKTYMDQYKAKFQELQSELETANVSLSVVEDLLYIWGNMTDDGHQVHGRRHWDFGGSFHFVYTIVSTIGKYTMVFLFQCHYFIIGYTFMITNILQHYTNYLLTYLLIRFG